MGIDQIEWTKPVATEPQQTTTRKYVQNADFYQKGDFLTLLRRVFALTPSNAEFQRDGEALVYEIKFAFPPAY